MIVRSFIRGCCEQNESMNSREVVGPLFIFQFAAKIGVIKSLVLVVERFDARKFFPLEEFK